MSNSEQMLLFASALLGRRRRVTGAARNGRQVSNGSRPPSPKRPASYFVVGDLDLAAETARLCGLDALGGAGGRLVTSPPELTVRRASRRPKARLGFAIPEQNRLSVTVYPGIRRGDLLETLLHELVHLAIGASAEGRRWHGRQFKATLRAAMAEAYGVVGVEAPSSYHGAYADALERQLVAMAG
jgi:SprT-like family